jgi:hypothetical protein
MRRPALAATRTERLTLTTQEVVKANEQFIASLIVCAGVQNVTPKT